MPGEPIFEIETALGECPVWDHRTNRLWWVDIDGRTVWRGNPETEEAESFPCSGRPGAIALTDDPDVMLVAHEGNLSWLRDGDFEPWLQLEDIAGNRLNDGRVGPDGSFWVGSMHADTSAGLKTGVLYRVTAEGTSTVIRVGIGVTNGLAFSPDGSTLFFADTATNTVERYSYPTTAANPPMPFADTTSLAGKPDGGCMDSEGRYWLAGVRGSQLYCYAPDGELVEVVDVPLNAPTRVAFGGPHLDRMFVTSIGPRSGDADARLDGRLLVVDVGATGLPEAVFPRRRTLD